MGQMTRGDGTIDLYKFPSSGLVALCEEESRAAPFCTLCAEGALVWGWPCTTMRHIAAIWADHADYDQGWKP